jgi:cell division protease FtsH
MSDQSTSPNDEQGSDFVPGRPDQPPETPRFVSRPRDQERKTRRPLAWWDRIKLVLLFLAAYVVMIWATLAQYQPIITFSEAARLTWQGYWWLLALAALEVVRQIHFLISEHSAAYHAFWTKRVFGRVSARTARMNDWNRFRLARVLKILFLLLILDLALAKAFGISPALALFEVPALLYRAAPFIFQLAFAFFFVIFQFVGLFWFLSRGGVETYMPDDIETRFSDVKGQDAVLDRVKENIIYLENPEAIEEKGGYVPGGILLWGPPGTGKTLMAQAVAGETGLPYVFVEPAAFTAMFIGVGVLKVRGLYRKLRKLALRYGGVIVFFDEADSLGSRGASGGGSWTHGAQGSPWSTTPSCNGLAYLSRDSAAYVLQQSLPASTVEPRGPGKDRQVMAGGMMGGGGMGTLQALLSAMDGLKKPRGFFNRTIRRLLGMRPKPPPKYRILHIFATNMPQTLDEALLRPGRIDRIYKVAYPSKEGRKATFWYYLDKVRHELTEEDIEKLATISPYATGATIKDTVNEGLVIAIRDGRDVITWPDIIRAKHIKEHGLPDDTEYVERERHAVAVHEACHAVVAYRLRKHALIDVATIERRGDVGGFVSFIPPEDLFVNWKSELQVDIMCSLASLAGERLFFEGDNSAGVAGDLRSATAVATRMEAFLGMGEGVGSHLVTKFAITHGASAATEDGTDRNLMESELGKRVEARLNDLLGRTTRLLGENRHEVLAVAHALEIHKTMSGDDVAAIVDGVRGPLVDGRPYHEAEFPELVEAYHSEALSAHKSHSQPALPLPILPAMGGQDGGGAKVGHPAPLAVAEPEAPRPDPQRADPDSRATSGPERSGRPPEEV